jgi:uncharacterized protein
MSTPTASTERIAILDTTRGIAVLGILLMNITGFGLPYAYEDPTNWGGSEGADLAAWQISSLFFEGTMRGLFTLLFGASVILFLRPHTAAPEQDRPASLYFRRTLWLIVFGLIDGYLLLWDGDILFYYGVVGLILFFFRNLAARKLIILAAVVLLLQTAVTATEYFGYTQLRAEAAAASFARSEGKPITREQQAAIDEFEDGQQDFKPSLAQLERTIEMMRDSYASAFAYMSARTWFVQTSYFLRHGLGDTLGMMLLGMALLNLGVLTGEASTRTYMSMTAIGYTLGLTINAFEMLSLQSADFDLDALMRSYLTYDAGRVPMTLGHVGLIMLMLRFRTSSLTARTFAAVGRMALTNYLTQSIICMFLFTGAGLALYGQLARHELYFIVLGIWIVQLAWSPLWLQRFHFGPLEWLWRSLTYWRKQPMRRLPEFERGGITS